MDHRDVDRDAISPGPFDGLPVELTQRAIADASYPREWLLAVLHDAGVSLGQFDIEAVDVVLEDREWDVVQAVGGWITRAGSGTAP